MATQTILLIILMLLLLGASIEWGEEDEASSEDWAADLCEISPLHCIDTQ